MFIFFVSKVIGYFSFIPNTKVYFLLINLQKLFPNNTHHHTTNKVIANG